MATAEIPPLAQVSDLELIAQEDNQTTEEGSALILKPEEIEDFALSTLKRIEAQERPSREKLIKLWKYLDLLWSGIGNFYWDSVANEFKIVTAEDLNKAGENADFDPTMLNKVVNLIRPYGESLAGVLTPGTPTIVFYPADADNPADLQTAKVSKIVEKKIADDNQIKKILVRIIVNLWNGGFCAVRNYCHKSPSYGQTQRETYEDKSFLQLTASCPDCENLLGNTETEYEPPDPNASKTIGPVEAGEGLEGDEEDQELAQNPNAQIPPQWNTCPTCNKEVTPVLDSNTTTRKVKTGIETIDKTRVLLDVYGPLNVKIPVKAETKAQVIWLLFEEDLHEADARERYPKYWDKIRGGDSSGELNYDRWARSQYENLGELTQYYTTIRHLHLRPAAYNILQDKELSTKMHAMYPKGCIIVFSNDCYLYTEECDLDEYWSLSQNPIYNRVYGDPLGKALIPLQEITNDIFQLEIETLKHAVPQTFADPKVLDFQAYSQSKARPGVVYPTKTIAVGSKISDGFYQTSTATLPKEVEILNTQVETLLQFISGVLPPVFGGTSTTGSKTLGEVEQNRNQALQRLSLVWIVVVNLYADFMSRAVKMYKNEILEDENFVERTADSFVNNWIKKAHLTGEIGRVVPEESEQFPTSWAQKSDQVMKLIGLNNEMVTSVLMHPNNIQRVAMLLGLNDLYIPGEDDRNKQITEIIQIIQMNSQALIDPMNPQVPVAPQVIQPEPTDNHSIHMAVLSAYLNSDQGQSLKDEKPLAYEALMMHFQAHSDIVAQQQAQAQAQANQNQDQNQGQGLKVEGPPNA